MASASGNGGTRSVAKLPQLGSAPPAPSRSCHRFRYCDSNPASGLGSSSSASASPRSALLYLDCISFNRAGDQNAEAARHACSLNVSAPSDEPHNKSSESSTASASEIRPRINEVALRCAVEVQT